MPALSCPVANRLFKRYSRAVGALRETQLPLLWGLVEPGPDYSRGREAVLQANAVVDAARREFWRHIQKHGCGYIGRKDYKKATKERLRAEMRRARKVFDSASEKYDHLVQLSIDYPAPADAGITLDQAQLVPMRAYEVYSDALRRYADYVVFGTLPESLSPEVSQRAKPN